MAMTPTGIQQLTPMERKAIRATAEHINQRAAAYALGISENTLKTHLVAVRRKLGAPSTVAAVRTWRASEQPHPKRISPTSAMADPPVATASVPDSQPASPIGTGVGEAHVPFVHDPSVYDQPEPQTERGHHGLTTLSATAWTVIIAAGLALILIATPPLADSFKRLRDVIVPLFKF